MAPSVTTGSLCGACKFLRRKCASDCIFAPYFSSEQGPARFAAIHKVFGVVMFPNYCCTSQLVIVARRLSPLLTRLKQDSSPRLWLRSSHLLLATTVKAQLAQNAMNSHTMYGQWEQNLSGLFPSIPNDPISPQSSLESVEVELNSGQWSQ
ncbi:hypothetical protein F3Y22_tig00111099pilonHSYRG00271 [Hibiscus syriacus]|uniref:LOB domain-containing protein n=1 Tax=Hibiscus syriacus TaxID=106335 RepID=A0A6A2Z0U4_HIBSY|nr:hypothetical protein F3Y22_tig00111099pilonHSYRG00271 [Hibiscus syriacus]